MTKTSPKKPLKTTTIKPLEDIAILRVAGEKLARVLDSLKKSVRINMSSSELEDLARELTEAEDAVPSFLGYTPAIAHRPYPAALCLSCNDVVVHGIPNERPFIIKEGDVLTLDMGISYKNLFVDAAITIPVGEVDIKGRKLIESGEACLDAAIEALKNWPKDHPKGIKTGDVGYAVEKALAFYRKTYGFNIVEIFGGHGVGYSVHEDPFIPNYGMKGQGVILKPGMVIAIEPIIAEGKGVVKIDDDGYTYRTKDGKRATHSEHTILITDSGAEVLTTI
ncbi:MAG: type I methionyl aminopeptidase [bacterium]